MRERRHSGRAEAAVDLTPMLDVVFILLIFFIVTSTFIQEKTLGLEPPPPPGPLPNTQIQSILVLIDHDSLIRVNGRLTEFGGVRANIERLRAESPDAALIIQAHPQARSGILLGIRDAAYSAQMPRVNVVKTATK